MMEPDSDFVDRKSIVFNPEPRIFEGFPKLDADLIPAAADIFVAPSELSSPVPSFAE